MQRPTVVSKYGIKVVVYKNWTKGGLVFPKRGPCTSILKDDVIHVMYNVIDIYVVPCCH